MDVDEKIEWLASGLGALDNLRSTHERIHTMLPMEVLNLQCSLLACLRHLRALFPWKKGDRARLLRTPEISSKKSWGWMGGKHYLIAGAEAEVGAVELSYDFSRWSLSLLFDDESWVDSSAKPPVTHPVPKEKRHLYGFAPSWVEKIEMR